MLSTWNHGMEANAAGFFALQQGSVPTFTVTFERIKNGAKIALSDCIAIKLPHIIRIE